MTYPGVISILIVYIMLICTCYYFKILKDLNLKNNLLKQYYKTKKHFNHSCACGWRLYLLNKIPKLPCLFHSIIII